MILLLINEKNKVQNCIYNLTQVWFKKKECREKVLGGNIPKYKQMFLLVDRIVGYTFTLLALHTFQIFCNGHVSLDSRKKWCEILENNRKYINHHKLGKVAVAENAHSSWNKDPCGQSCSCDYDVGQNGRKEMISLVLPPTNLGHSPCWLCQGLSAPPPATSGLGSPQAPLHLLQQSFFAQILGCGSFCPSSFRIFLVSSPLRILLLFQPECRAFQKYLLSSCLEIQETRQMSLLHIFM